MRTTSELAAAKPGAAGADNAQPRIIATAQAAGGFTLRVWGDSLLDGAAAQGFTLRHAGNVGTDTVPSATLNEGESSVVLEVAVQGARGLKALLCDVEYDGEQWHALDTEVVPDSAGGSTASDNASARYLSLAQTAEAGRAYYGLVRRNYAAAAGLEGDAVLLRLHFAAGGAARHVSVAGPPTGTDCQAPLSWDAGRGALDWLYYNTGDYDQNGKVGLTDLLPLGLFYGDKAPGGKFAAQTARSVADGNADGWLSVADLVPLSMSWDASCTTYGLYSSLDSADYPASASVPPNPALLVAEVDFSASQLDPGARRRFSYTPAAAEPGRYFWVRPSDGAASGMPSTLCRVPTQPTPMESAWPMPGHDLQRTSRSEYVGPQTAKLKWSYRPQAQVEAKAQTVPINNGVAYAGVSGELHAYYPNGDLKWVCEGLTWTTNSIIGPGGKLYIAGGEGVYCLDPSDGHVLWLSPTPSYPYMALGANQLVYTCNDETLRAITLDGAAAWEHTTGYKLSGAPVIGPDGLIVVNSADVVYAFEPDGSIRWLKNISWPTSTLPTIGADGSVYVTNMLYLICIDRYGVLKYYYQDPSGWIFDSTPVCGPGGRVYCLCTNGQLVALDAVGQLLWKYNTGRADLPPPATGPDGLLYVASDKLLALNDAGELQSEHDLVNGCLNLGAFAVTLQGSKLSAIPIPEGMVTIKPYNTDLCANPVLAKDGSVLLHASAGPSSGQTTSLIALNKAGTETWRTDVANSYDWQTLLPTGNVLFNESDYNTAYMAEYESYAGLAQEQSVDSLFGPIVDIGAGRLLRQNNKLVCLDTAGSPSWEYSSSYTNSYDYNWLPLAVTPAGGIYYPDTNDSGSSRPGQLVKLGADGAVLNAHSISGRVSALLVLDDHRCAVVLCSYESNEELRYSEVAVYDDDAGKVWSQALPYLPDDNQCCLALGLQGEIVVPIKLRRDVLEPSGLHTYAYTDCIRAYSPDGELLWQTEEVSNILTNLTLDAQGTCYALCSDGMRAYAPDGSLRWHYLLATYAGDFAVSKASYCAPIIGSDGKLYVPNLNGKLYAFQD